MGKKIVYLILLISTVILTVATPCKAKETPYYTIQVANTKNFKEAKQIFEKIKRFKYSRIDKVKTRYKVRIGLFKTKKEAQEFFRNHPEIKKVSPTAYITLNYYNPERTILKGNFPEENRKEQKETEKTEKQTKEEKKKTSILNQQNKQKLIKKHEKKETLNKNDNYIVIKVEKTVVKVLGFAVSGFLILILLIGLKLIKRKHGQGAFEESEESFKKSFLQKIKDIYYTLLKYLPIKTSQKIIEYHYKKSGDFRSLILMKLQEQDFNFILREAPQYLLKNPDDILVWKIYIEVLGQLGIYDEAASACEKLAEILKKNSRPEAAENYIKKAKEYKEKALKLAENL